jgi:MFS family permease
MSSLFADPGTRTFLRIWTGLTVSLLGSALTAFALGVWIFRSTSSTTQYALVMFFTAVPPLVLLPLGGPIIDRVPRKRLLVACDVAGALGTAAVCLLSWTGALTLAWACGIVTVIAAASALQVPTYLATVTLLVPAGQLGRASGLTQLGQALSSIVAPLLAGALVVTVGLSGIAAIDLATFAFSIAMLLSATIPDAAPSGRERPSYLRDLPFGWRYIARHAGLLALLAMFLSVNFFAEIASVLFTPFVLSFSTPTALGWVLSFGGVGMLAGGALMTLWGGPRRPALFAALFAAAGGAAIVAAGFTASIVGLAAVVAIYFLFIPLVAGSSQVVWQRIVPADAQGRVFATRAAIALSAAPLAPLVAGPLADLVFEPAMSPGGALAPVLGPMLGVGPGRGMAVILVMAGVLSVLAALGAAAFRPLRLLDAPTPAAAAPAPPTLAPANPVLSPDSLTRGG